MYRSVWRDMAVIQLLEKLCCVLYLCQYEDGKRQSLTIFHHLKILFKVWKLSGWFPHELCVNNKADWLRIFIHPLQSNQQTTFLNNFVSGNKSWLPTLQKSQEGLRFFGWNIKRHPKRCPLQFARRQCGGTEWSEIIDAEVFDYDQATLNIELRLCLHQKVCWDREMAVSLTILFW